MVNFPTVLVRSNTRYPLTSQSALRFPDKREVGSLKEKAENLSSLKIALLVRRHPYIKYAKRGGVDVTDLGDFEYG